YQQGSPTSTNDVKKVDLKLYPNPAQETLIVETATGDHSALIEVYSVMGIKVLSQNATGNKTIISLNQLAAGSYVATYRNDKSFESIPFVKMD
ncbi:MAG: hypothetical protein ACJAYL_002917, partial [Cryomorphaceae bacterium]